MDKLTSRVESLERSMLQAAVDLSYIKGRIEDMPTKDWVTTRVFWAVGAFSGVVGLISVIQTLILKSP